MKLVDIPIQRFQPETPLTRDTFLFLPLNNRAIRIATAGEVIPEAMLARIQAKGHTHLRIAEDSAIDPESFLVHPAPPPPPPALAQASPEPQTVISPDNPIHEQITLIAKSGEEPEASTVIAASEPGDPEPTQTFSAETLPEESTNVAGSRAAAEKNTLLSALTADEESQTRLRGDIEEVSEQTISGLAATEEKYVRKFAAEKEALPAVIRLQKRMAEGKDESTASFAADKESALKEARTVILSSKISEKIISLSEQARAAEPGLRESLRGQVRSLKNSLDQLDGGDLSVDEEIQLEAQEEIAAVVESLASASRAEQLA
jgi:hypothetical protein